MTPEIRAKLIKAGYRPSMLPPVPPPHWTDADRKEAVRWWIKQERARLKRQIPYTIGYLIGAIIWVVGWLIILIAVFLK